MPLVKEGPEARTLTEYICERDGFHYMKVSDYRPYLCYRCMRFMAKRTWTIVNQIVPAVSRPERDDI